MLHEQHRKSGSAASRTTAGADPTSSRRREISSPSARSLLLTVLGEFVHPRREKVWTGTLVEALSILGIEEKSARQALTRASSEGVLSSTRLGRRAMWDLTDTGRQLLDEGAQRIYGFMRDSRPWDGRWLVLNISIPEAQRQLRHRLRTRLTWLGLGSPNSGLWVSPDASKEPAVHRVIRELGVEDRTFAWTGPTAAIGDETKLLEDAWDLDEVEDRYLAFLEEFENLRVTTSREAFVAQVNIVQAWRRFPFLDPDLPSELLDHDWPGPRAAAVFHDRHTRWHRQAQNEWDALDAAEGPKS